MQPHERDGEPLQDALVEVNFEMRLVEVAKPRCRTQRNRLVRMRLLKRGLFTGRHTVQTSLMVIDLLLSPPLAIAFGLG